MIQSGNGKIVQHLGIKTCFQRMETLTNLLVVSKDGPALVF